MTQIKLCGLRRREDILTANALLPEYIGFVFAQKSRRYVTPEQAAELKRPLDGRIKAVGVFVDETPEAVARLLKAGIIDLAQLHGYEDEAYLSRLRSLTDKKLIQAFRIRCASDVESAGKSSADHILLDAGAGDGATFDWRLLEGISRPYFLAGGLNPHVVAQAIKQLHPYGVDVSSGIETDGLKDREKAAAFIAAVRKEERS
jgi:phosphoribosylanthranilate isomerase